MKMTVNEMSLNEDGLKKLFNLSIQVRNMQVFNY